MSPSNSGISGCTPAEDSTLSTNSINPARAGNESQMRRRVLFGIPALQLARPLLAAGISVVYLALIGLTHPEECLFAKGETEQPVYSQPASNQPAEPERKISFRSLLGLSIATGGCCGE